VALGRIARPTKTVIVRVNFSLQPEMPGTLNALFNGPGGRPAYRLP
jgi:hypothetical protein